MLSLPQHSLPRSVRVNSRVADVRLRDRPHGTTEDFVVAGLPQACRRLELLRHGRYQRRCNVRKRVAHLVEHVLLNDCGDLASFIVSLLECRGVLEIPGCCVNDRPRQLYNRSDVNLDAELRKMM